MANIATLDVNMYRAYQDMASAVTSEFSEIYSAYAAGCLDPGFALMVETQASLRPEVKRALVKAEMIAGIMLETEAEALVSDGALDRTFAMIDAFEAEERPSRPALKLASDALEEILALPEPLRDSVLESSIKEDWKMLTPGVRRLAMHVGSEAEVELYRIEPNKTVPRHSHSGSEFTLVVTGGFTDETGHYGAGELSIKGPDNTHQPTADTDGVCYALSLREGGLKFTGMMGVVQRLLGQ